MHVRQLAAECGFELAGVASAAPATDFARYSAWTAAGYEGEMRYLTGHRGDLRSDPRHLLAAARSVVCVGKLYNGPEPYSTNVDARLRGWISRYAWGEDYHTVVREGLERLAARIAGEHGPHEWRACVDTAPLLERSLAREAGLGWIGKNTCLINEPLGSWFFLGELLTSHEFAPDMPPPGRCGSCTRCIDACPTAALVPDGAGGYTLDARRCISYFTIELRGPAPAEHRAAAGSHVFGCDICQDVCPWNRRAPTTRDPRFAPMNAPAPLDELAAISESEFRALFRRTPVSRAKYAGFLRNVAVAMGNSGNAAFEPALRRLTGSPDAAVAEAAAWGLARLADHLVTFEK